MGLTDAQMVELYLIPKHWHPKNKYKYEEADLYSLSRTQLEEKTNKKNGNYFFVKKTDQRFNDDGYWVSVGEAEGVKRPNNDFLGTKSKFRYYFRNTGAKSDWYITEYCIDDGFRAKLSIPRQPAEFVFCKLEKKSE